MALDHNEIAVILAWASGIVSADDARRALGDADGPLTRMELVAWEMDAIETGRLVVEERLAGLPVAERIEVFPAKERAA